MSDMNNKCNPVDMRKNLEVVETLKAAGIDFVCIPVTGNKEALIKQMHTALDLLIFEGIDGE